GDDLERGVVGVPPALDPVWGQSGLLHRHGDGLPPAVNDHRAHPHGLLDDGKPAMKLAYVTKSCDQHIRLAYRLLMHGSSPHPQGTFIRTRANHYFSHVSRACKVGIGPPLLAFIPTQSSLCARPEKNRMALSGNCCYRRHLPPFRFTGHWPLFSRHSPLATRHIRVVAEGR